MLLALIIAERTQTTLFANLLICPRLKWLLGLRCDPPSEFFDEVLSLICSTWYEKKGSLLFFALFRLLLIIGSIIAVLIFSQFKTAQACTTHVISSWESRRICWKLWLSPFLLTWYSNTSGSITKGSASSLEKAFGISEVLSPRENLEEEISLNRVKNLVWIHQVKTIPFNLY